MGSSKDDKKSVKKSIMKLFRERRQSSYTHKEVMMSIDCADEGLAQKVLRKMCKKEVIELKGGLICVNGDVLNKTDKGNDGQGSKEESRVDKKRKRSPDEAPVLKVDDFARKPSTTETLDRNGTNSTKDKYGLHFDCNYILAPMVGASELPFRLLCRKYGAQAAYTPMMSSQKFATDPLYRSQEFQTVPWDRPLVCHFSANDPNEFALAAKLVEDQCDAIDLNLGCPQRTAYVGHFGSYLLEPKDRKLICNIVSAAKKAVSVPIFVKIRLLDTLEETIKLCTQLCDAGVSLITIHARYRASWCRNGPGARDGPAMLDQILEIKKVITDIPIIANGNVITYEDVEKNLNFTQADGIMSAEGILDNPALYLPRMGGNDESAAEKEVVLNEGDGASGRLCHSGGGSEGGLQQRKKKRKYEKKLREIESIEKKMAAEGVGCITKEQEKKLATKSNLKELLDEVTLSKGEPVSRHNCIQIPDYFPIKGNKDLLFLINTLVQQVHDSTTLDLSQSCVARTVTLKDLYKSANDKLALAHEYLNLARKHPAIIRTVVFHTRRMCRDLLNEYQLMEDCVACKSLDEVESVLRKCSKYRDNPNLFRFDKEKEKQQEEALVRKKQEEGKRKNYEARMMRKAKREGKSDLEFYLRQGTELPTVDLIKRLKSLSRDEQLIIWKKSHSQHCMAHHLDSNGCGRLRSCAFLHVDAKGAFTFNERDECAG